ncbi:hypothetical protein GOBAR_AA13450 [Gossypium barbadense]|uniref:Uncharacterized protein n=1 Tax=Gossypium barbadense TaxID=3634 RepID=A0A2P5XV99_GOSBA|nr:hypothetical protein GOBAR_AA13450 [Gossypium barbadense]
MQGSNTFHHEESKRKSSPLLDLILTEKNSDDTPRIQGSGTAFADSYGGTEMAYDALMWRAVVELEAWGLGCGVKGTIRFLRIA